MNELSVQVKRMAMNSFIGLAAFLLMLANASAAELTPARLWKFSPHPGTTVFILGITHFGSRLENDDYFRDRVLPVFESADVLHFEDGGSTPTNLQPPCAKPLNGRDAAVVEEARRVVRRGAVDYFRTILADLPGGAPGPAILQANAERYARGLSEFGLVVTLRTQYRFLSRRVPPTSNESGAAPVLNMLRLLRPTLDVRSLDEPGDLVSAYCSSNARAGILKWHVDHFDPDKEPEQATRGAALEQMEQTARALFVDRHTDPDLLGDMLICPRNERWLPRLTALNDGKIHFEAIGASHLFPYEGVSRRCDGLLQDLRRMGMEITPVQ